MAIQYTRASAVVAGTVPTSSEMNQLTAAFNDRLTQGIGDPTWRIWWKAWSMFRGLVAAEETLSPSEDEWFKIWMHVPPADGFSANPLTSAHPWVRWAVGDGGLAPEDERINVVPSSPSTDPATAWGNGKAQRGYVTTDGLHAAPAFESAIAHYNIYSWALIDATGGDHSLDNSDLGIQNKTSYKFFKTFGGYSASPDIVDCDGNHSRRFFTNYRTGEVSEFSTCGGAPDCARIEYGATQYIIYRAVSVPDDPEEPDGPTHTEYSVNVRLPYHTYIEGPYGGDSFLQKQNSWIWNEVLCRYAQTFKGSDAQRAGEAWKIGDVAFDFQRFFAVQYRLAPAYSENAGDGSIDARYPKVQFTGPAAVDTHGTWVEGYDSLKQGDDGYRFDSVEGFGLAGYIIHAEGLTEPVRVYLNDDNGQYAVSLTVENGDKVVWLDAAKQANFVQVTNSTEIPDGAVVSIEFAHLQIYRPQIVDAYVVLRRGTADAYGPDCSDSKALSDEYVKNGHILCSADVASLTEDDLNAGPVYESTRQMLREHLRFIDREQYGSYTVVDGKSVVRFDRFLSFGGHSYDLFEGIAPPFAAIESGKLVAGLEYEVRGASGTVDYNGTTYAIGDTVTSVDGVLSYAHTGDAGLWQKEGIIATAPKNGHTNKWLMFMTFCPYGGVGYEDDDYNDILGFLINRCMINSIRLQPSEDADMTEHFCMNPTGALCVKPEGPSGFNYSSQMNNAADADFLESCPIYPPDYQVESVTMDYGTNQVVVRFAGRFRIGGDDVRSDENGLQDYEALLGADTACPNRVGDVAFDAVDAPTHGACKPRFYFTKMAEEVYEDSNDTSQGTDTRRFADRLLWLHFILEAMCEGYLDLAAPASTCKRQPCYTFQNLCFQGVGKKWFTVLPSPKINTDNHQGFGPMPNMKPYVEYFNSLASCVNLLTTFPVELPYTVQYRIKETIGSAPGGATYVDMFGDDFSAKNDAITHSALAFSGRLDSDWTDWAPLALGPGLAMAYYQCGQNSEALFTDPIDGLPHTLGYDSIIDGGGGQRFDPVGTTDPLANAGQGRLQFRVNVAGLGSLEAGLLELLNETGAVSVQMHVFRTWATTVTGEGDAECGGNLAWGFPGSKMVYHDLDGLMCIGVPFNFADDNDGPIEVNIPPLGDPATGVFTLARWIGQAGGNCTWGASVSAYTTNVGYLVGNVPLV